MIDLLTSIGFDATTPWGIFWICTAWIFLTVTAIWVIGLFQTDHSMMDGYYGFGYATQCWIAYLLFQPKSTISTAIFVMASLHGVRLGYYLSNRWVGYQKKWGHGDQRYVGFTKTLSPGYWWKSFFMVMEPQAVVIAVIGLPSTIGMMMAANHEGPLNALACVGLLVFGIGYYYETVADGQLQAFKADPHNAERYLRTGVWTHTRHPNYFGNTCVWWGIWLVAVAGNPSVWWWTIAGPVFNTIMLTGILGRAFQDKFMGSRPAYQKVMRETSSFLPIPKRAR